MPDPKPDRAHQWRVLIHDFIRKRRDEKLEGLQPDDPKRQELMTQFEPATWLADAAKRVSQLQGVTHTLKAIHPDAKGSSCYAEPGQLPPLEEVGSHCLGSIFDMDVVGNAAALDVYKLLKLSDGRRSLLQLACDGDADLCAALDNDPHLASAWMAAFALLVAPRSRPSSHTNAKQIYWLAGELNPHDDRAFHLLAPLYPSSLLHRVHGLIQSHRFDESAQAARAARKKSLYSETPVHEYPDLAIQKLGGSKPQNISQLNSERRGDNLLLCSVPPVWQRTAVQPLRGSAALFRRLGQRPGVRQALRQLRAFLQADPAANQVTRQHRDELLAQVLDELMQLSAELRSLPAGWSQDPACKLDAAERQWLDTGAAPAQPLPPDGVWQQIAHRFAVWLNAELRNPLAMGDSEYRRWRAMAEPVLRDFMPEAAHAD